MPGSLIYNLSHVVHLLVGAAWVGVALSCDYLTWTFERADDRVERLKSVRRLLVRVEMPIATITPIVGIVLAAMRPHYFREGWLHTKLTAVVVLLLFTAFAAVRNRRLLEAATVGDTVRVGKSWHGYLAMRMVGWVAFAIIFVAVVFRPVG